MDDMYCKPATDHTNMLHMCACIFQILACEWNNTCYQDNEIWTDGCVDYRCVVNRQEAEVKWGVETVKLGKYSSICGWRNCMICKPCT